MAKKKATSVTSKSKVDLERDDIAVKVASGLANISAQGNTVNYLLLV